MRIVITVLDGSSSSTFEGVDLVEPPPVGQGIILYTKNGDKRGFVRSKEMMENGKLHVTFQLDTYVGSVESEEICINVWDDSPPHAPIYVESCPEGLSEEEILSEIFEHLRASGFTIDENWVRESGESHDDFLSGVVASISSLGSIKGHPLVVYSES